MMTDERHMDETQPDQATTGSGKEGGGDREPTGFGDLPLQPTGSGIADEQAAYEESARDDPPEGTAGYGNTGRPAPAIEGGQPGVGEDDARETRNTEF